jgi:tight adherence protein C
MDNPLLVTLLFLVPAFLLMQEDFSLETASMQGIHKLGDRTSVRLKLEELGHRNHVGYENFRYKQLILASTFSFATILIGTLKKLSIPSVIGLILLSVSGTIYFLEWRLDRQVKAHRIKIESEFPSVVEMLALSLSAGESPLGALQRVSSRGSGILVGEFSQVVTEVRDGNIFADSLDHMGKRIRSTNIRRFIDSLIIAIVRGAPLVEVLQSHAKEAQGLERNRILSSASKSEVSMMIPVVFLILPISILFALWPSLSSLNLYS